MWRLVEVPESEAAETDLTDGELFGVSVCLANTARKSANDDNCYQRAWEKIQPAAQIANSR